MSLARPIVYANEVTGRQVLPGDLLSGGENILAGGLATNGAGTITGAMVATGIIRRTGVGANYTDTFDTATNIVAALKGNAPAVDITPGTSFRLLIQNTVAFAATLAASAGVVLGTGTTAIAASKVREYLVTVQNADGPYSVNTTLVSGNTTALFVLPTGQASLQIGPSPQAVNITAGMTVTGTNITTGTKVAGVTQGQGGITGVTLDTVASGSGTQSLVYGPSILVDGLRSSDL